LASRKISITKVFIMEGPEFNMRYQPILSKLLAVLENVNRSSISFITTVTTNEGDWYGTKTYFFNTLSRDQEIARMEIFQEQEKLHESLMLLLTNAPEKIQHQYASASSSFQDQINLRTSILGAENCPDKRKERLQASLTKIREVIEFLQYASNAITIIIPDTNSLLSSTNPRDYKDIVQTKDFTFHLLPTVLSELDSLKVNHKNPDVREKAKDAIRRIKGWRHQGSLSAGITYHGTITIRASHKEPDIANSLAWLDPEVKDDRIIASVLEIQVSNPAALVVLATSDINLQNKADAAMIEVAEIS